LYNRSGFFLHGGDRPGSAGCIDVGQNDVKLFPEIIKHSGPIKVNVDYNKNSGEKAF